MATGEIWRLGRRPALDGLRGIAVALVVFAHLFDVFPPGTVGVAIFFTLSGFLITSILVTEHSRSGRVRLHTFYVRRLLRLLPALVALVIVVGALGQASGIAVGATLLYVANWYAAAGGDLGLLTHTWSLGVEEQFYLVWPLVVVALGCHRRPLLWVSIVGSAVAIATRLVLLDHGTWDGALIRWPHTRADGLLIGCTLALWMHDRHSKDARPRTATWGVGALFVCVALPTAWGASWAPTIVALLTAVVIFAVVRGDYRGWLAWEPLVLLGQRSYGLYLWHLPVIAWVATADLPPGVDALTAVAIAWVLTLLSWRFVEMPFLRLKDGPSRSKDPRAADPVVDEVDVVDAPSGSPRPPGA